MRKLLLGLIGLLFAVPAVATDLPAGYTELQYIESTGTQYITTNIVPTATDKISLEMEFVSITSSGKTIMGARDAAASGAGINFAASDSSMTLDFFGTRYNISEAPELNKIYKYEVVSKVGTIYKNGVSLGSNTFPAQGSLSLPLAIFGLNNGGNIAPSGHSYKIRSVVVEGKMNLIPAKNSSGVVGMYDTVSGNFFTNAGTGEFIAGPEVGIRIATTAYNSARFSPVVTELNDTIATIRSVVTNTINHTKAIADLQATKQTRPDETCPAGKKCLLVEDDAGQPHWYEIIENAYGLPNGYTALEYLQGKGSTHIVPGVTINSNLKIDIKYEILTPGWLLGGTIGESGRWGVTSSNTFYSGTSGVADISSATNLSGINTATFNYKTGATVNGVNIPFGTEQTYGNVTAKQFYLFSADGTGVSTQEHKIYYANIYNGETLVRSLVPAKRNSDSVLGMYDTVNDVFYTNAGSGTFVAGPVVQ